jgi:hypothetical protein
MRGATGVFPHRWDYGAETGRGWVPADRGLVRVCVCVCDVSVFLSVLG